MARYRAALSALVSPIDHSDTEAWAQAALGAVVRVLGGGCGLMALPHGRVASVFTQGMDQAAVERYQANVVDTEQGRNVYYAALEPTMQALREAGLRVHTSDDAVRLSGIPLVEHPHYTEVLRPSGAEYTITMTAPLERGEALLGVAHRGPESRRFGDRDRALLELLLPAFEAGVRSWHQLLAHGRALEATLACLRDGASIYDRRGRAVYENTALQNLARDDPEFDRIRAAMARMAAALTDGTTRRMRRPDTTLLGFGAGSVRTSQGGYTLTPSLLPERTFGREPVALVLVSPNAPQLPAEGQLRARFAFTRREAEVARLLARGLSNRQIAIRLSISSSTARHHAQRVLEKAGVHTRKALALRFLQSGDLPGEVP